jgi:hypothetical protein
VNKYVRLVGVIAVVHKVRDSLCKQQYEQCNENEQGMLYIYKMLRTPPGC